LPDPYWIGAQVCAVLAEVNSAKGKHYKIADFMPRMVSSKAAAQQSTEEMLAQMKGIGI